jgi:hypothetical protein
LNQTAEARPLARSVVGLRENLLGALDKILVAAPDDLAREKSRSVRPVTHLFQQSGVAEGEARRACALAPLPRVGGGDERRDAGPLEEYGEAAAGAPAAGGRAARLRPGVLRDGPILRTVLAYSGHSWELYVSRAWLAAFLATVLAARGLSGVDSVAEGGKWAALMAGLGAAGVWLGGWLSDRWGRARAAAALAALSGGLSLGFGWLGGLDWAALVVLGCLYGLLTAADSAIYSTAVTELAPPGQLGSAQAAQAFLGFLASTIAPVAAGLVLDLGGGFGGAFALAGLASLAGALALLPLARETPGPRPLRPALCGR